jgi:hypothetical protein
MLKTSLAGAAAAMALLGMGAGAHAQDAHKSYYQVGAAATDLGGDTFGAFNVGIGHNFTQNFAVELDGNVGVTSKNFSGVKVKIDYAVGAYGVVRIPLNPSTDFLVRAGDLQAQLKGAYQGLSVTSSANGPAFGFGVRYFPNAGLNGVRGDITHYDFGSNGKGEIYQVDYVRKF